MRDAPTGGPEQRPLFAYPSLSTSTPPPYFPPLIRLCADKYVSTAYEVSTDDMWNSLGYLALFILFFQFAAFLSMAYVRHILR